MLAFLQKHFFKCLYAQEAPINNPNDKASQNDSNHKKPKGSPVNTESIVIYSIILFHCLHFVF